MDDFSNTRRNFLLGALVTPMALGVAACARAADNATPPSAEVLIEKFSARGISTGKAKVPRVVKTDEDWRKQLSDISFAVARKAGTERPFTGKYNDNHADGVYRCICCHTNNQKSGHYWGKYMSGR